MSLAELRADLKESLESVGIKAFEYLPERVQPPIALITPSDPYVEQGSTYTLFDIGLTVTLITAKATNPVATAALDELIENAIIATGDWLIDKVGAPFLLEANNAQFLAARLTLTQQIEIGGS